MSRRRERLSNYLGTLVSSPKRASNTAPFWSLSAIRGSTGATLTNDVFRASLPESCTSSTNVTLSRELPPETSEESNKSTRSSTSVRQSESPQLESPVDGQRQRCCRSLRRKSEGNGRLERKTRQTEDETSNRNTRGNSQRETSNNDELKGDEVERLSQLENNLSFVLKVLQLHETFLQRKFQLEFDQFATPLGDEIPPVHPTSLSAEDEDIAESSATFHAISTSLNAGRRSSEQSKNPPASSSSVNPIGIAVDSNIQNRESRVKDFVGQLECNSSSSDTFGGDELQREEEEDETLRSKQTDCNLSAKDDEDSLASDETSESGEEAMRRDVRLPTRTTKLKHKRKSGEMRRSDRSESSKRRSELERPICHKTCSTKGSLQQHKVIHDPEKKWKCSECPRTFRRGAHLRVHERIHTNEKPFQCSLCSKTFRYASNVKCHERIHLNEKPFKCYFCTKAFTEKAHLLRHQRIHSGERPFKCRLCPKSFRQPSDLKRHERTHKRRNPQVD